MPIDAREVLGGNITDQDIRHATMISADIAIRPTVSRRSSHGTVARQTSPTSAFALIAGVAGWRERWRAHVRGKLTRELAA